MKIKVSNSRQASECPEDKLKFLSYIDELQNTMPLNPLTPERANKAWVVDAWEGQHEDFCSTPERSQYINQMLQSYEAKSFRMKKLQPQSEKTNPQNKFLTPRGKEEKQGQEKENRPRSRLYSVSKPARRPEVVEEQGPFKVALGSVVYPVIRGPDQKHKLRQRGCRIERFHSFVARTIRK